MCWLWGHNVSLYCFADNIQVYISIRSDSKTLQPLLSCHSDLKTWMKINLLNLNENKMGVICFGKSAVLCGSADTLVVAELSEIWLWFLTVFLNWIKVQRCGKIKLFPPPDYC